MLPVKDGRIPMSDGAGEVVALGAGVTRFAVGDKVMSTFFPNWSGGPVSAERTRGVPGDHVDGFAAELVALPAAAFTRIPKGYTYEQAATLPCAALIAWRALFVENATKPGDIVLTQGSGGVSVFAIQLAKAAGARVIATSSSQAKLDRLAALGADHLINYRETPAWGVKAREIAVQDDEIDRLYHATFDEVVGPRYASSAPPPGVTKEKYARQHHAVEYLTEHFHEAPVWIVACLDEGKATPTRWSGASVYPAVQNMLLAARALGLGSTLTTRHLLYAREAEAAMGLPEGVHSYAILPIGWPMGRFGPVGRTVLADVVFSETWGQRYAG